MPREIEVAYPLLIRQWQAQGGEALRLRPPGVKGVPDFLLTHRCCGNVLCEVKAVESAEHDIGLSVMQTEMLDTNFLKGGRAFVLALHLERKTWAGFRVGNLEYTWRMERWNLQWRQGHEFKVLTTDVVMRLTR